MPALKRLRKKVRDFVLRFYDRCILHIYDLFIIWLWKTVHPWLDARTVAQAVEAPPSRAQRALAALEAWPEQYAEKSRAIRLVAELIARLAGYWKKLGFGSKAFLIAAAGFVVAAIRCWASGEPFELTFGAIVDSVICGLAVIFVALTAANLLIIAVVAVLLALALPLHLWRLAEVIGGFVIRHLLPRGIVWRYTWWRLRRTGRRRLCAALVDSEIKVTPLAITLSDGTFQYAAEVIEENGRYFYRVEDITVEITKSDYERVIGNPRLYYFSTALKLHFVVERIKKTASDYTTVTCKDFQNNPKK